MQKQIAEYVESIIDQIIGWRREFHRFPEVGWTEFRTAAVVADTLSELGFTVKLGREVINEASRMGVPPASVVESAKQRAIRAGLKADTIAQFENGLTGVVGIWDTGRPGPTVAFRFDMDALQILEDESEGHFPFQENFRSEVAGTMHACGHDGHTAIGLGLAALIVQFQEHLTGKIKLIFQPAEEGARGAKAMVDAGVTEDIDFLFIAHIGLMARRQNMIVSGVTNFLASNKIDVTLTGVPAHAAFAPQEGRNALLASATIAIQLHAIARHGDGESRINVGKLEAGEGRNIIPASAKLLLETRGSTNEVNRYMTEEAIRIIQSVAKMYDVKETIEVVGESIIAPCDSEAAAVIEQAANKIVDVTEVISSLPFNASEDATYMMQAVQERGGKATYSLLGSQLQAGHHHHAFDFNEQTLRVAVQLFGNVLTELNRIKKTEEHIITP